MGLFNMLHRSKATDAPVGENDHEPKPALDADEQSAVRPHVAASSYGTINSARKGYFRSCRISEAELDGRLKFHRTPQGTKVLRTSRWVFLGCMSTGVFGSVALLATTFLNRDKNKYCLVLDEQFDGSALDTSIWTREVGMGGFGNGQFSWMTDSATNSFVENGKLYIVPTLTSDLIGVDAITNGYTANLTASGTCTGTSLWNNTKCLGDASNVGSGYQISSDEESIVCSSVTNLAQCAAVSNLTTGAIIRPIQSARLTTNLSTAGNGALRFGRVEVSAKLPTGDWLWPAIWMLPRDNAYGAWPKSGEIDIVTSKGNLPSFRSDQQANSVRSALHWGASTGAGADKYIQTSNAVQMARSWFNRGFTTFGLEWTPDRVETWRETRARGIFGATFDQTFWRRGGYAKASNNAFVNPWAISNLTKIAPFDQEFYLILSVAAGGTDGYFADDGLKPWANSGVNPALDFWNAREAWYPTWPTEPKERGMAVEYIKMWRIAEKGEIPGQADCKA